jgi:hypothetical protein
MPPRRLLILTVLAATSCAGKRRCGPPCVAASPARPAQTSRPEARSPLAALERGVADPDVVVDFAYVRRLFAARDAAAAGFSDSDGRGPVVPDAERRALALRLRDALPAKRGPALAAAVETVLWLGDPRPDAGVRAAALRAWPTAGAEFRRNVLDHGWSVVRSVEFVPLLRAACDALERREPPRTEWHVDDVPTLALLRLLETAPSEGRARILADVRRDDPRFGGRALVALPDAHLREVDAHFRRPPEEMLHWRFDLEKLGPLAERYGGPDAVEAAKRLLDRPDADRARFAGSALLLRVVLAHDREEGLRRLGAALRRPSPPGRMPPAALLREVLAGNWVQRIDLWGDDAEALVRDLAADESIDAETRESATRLLAERAAT